MPPQGPSPASGTARGIWYSLSFPSSTLEGGSREDRGCAEALCSAGSSTNALATVLSSPVNRAGVRSQQRCQGKELSFSSCGQTSRAEKCLLIVVTTTAFQFARVKRTRPQPLGTGKPHFLVRQPQLKSPLG